MIIDNFSRFTWMLFLAHKNEAFDAFSKLFKKIINEKRLNVLKIRNDYDIEFENHDFATFYFENSIEHNFVAPRTT